MHTTGSRGRLGVHPTMLRLLIGAALLLAFAGFAGMLSQRADAGGGAVFVNTTANTDDGQCNGPPNDGALGNCTLHEAIDRVNLGFADTIKFHAAIFPNAAPGVIDLEAVDPDDTAQYGQDYDGLPPIMREATIDNTGTGVVIHCDTQHNGTWGVTNDCNWGLRVEATHNGFDFKLIGAKNFVIKEIPGQGISMDGGAFSFGVVDISGVDINVNDIDDGVASDGDDAIDIRATNLNNIDITNSILAGDDDNDSDTGLRILAYGDAGGDLFNNNVDVTGNRIFGGDGVDIDFRGDLWSPGGLAGAAHVINANVNENDQVTGDAGDGIEIGYCRGEGGSCDARHSVINFNVLGNGKISSNDDNNDNGDGVRLTVEATETGCVPACNEAVTTNLKVDGNAIIDGDDDDGVKVDVTICCATSNSVGRADVTNNDDIVGDDEGVEIDMEVGDGGDNRAVANVDDNGEIVGEGGHGVDLDVTAGTSDGSNGDIDADENEVDISISGNDDIAGDNGDGISVEAVAGKQEGPGDADRNDVAVNIDGNEDIDGDDDGISVEARAGTDEGPGDADDNTATVRVIANGTIDGADDEGVDIDVEAGHTQDDAQAPNVTGDGNTTNAVVDNNDRITGHDGHGIQVDSFAGALESTGENNETNVTIINNQEIQGQGGEVAGAADGNVAGGPLNFDSGSDGIHIDSVVCCDPANVNNVLIDNNDDIIGRDGDGIDIDELCCSTNFVTITDNDGVIKGNDDNGVEVSPCLENGDPENIREVTDDDMACMGDTVTELIITGNNISDSGRDGILVCCGLFQLPSTQAPPAIAGLPLKSRIANNTIAHNGEDGIDLDTTIGINVEHNDVFANGTSAQDGDNGIELDWQFGWWIWDISGGTVKIPAHFNRVSQNTIYDNVGLGINLIGAVDVGGTYYPASGAEFVPAIVPADGVGCTPLPTNAIVSNDCMLYPKVLFTGGPGNKVSGSACGGCHVELFYADETPADQTGPLNRQHGEGKTYIMTQTADNLGQFSALLPCGLDAGLLTATATDKLKNTSEFSSNVPFPGTPPCATDTPTATATSAVTDTPVAPTDTPVPPTATPTVTFTPTPSKLCGDVNDDGLVNAIDAQLILQLRAGLINTLPNLASGDVNRDFQVTAVDASLILQKAAGQIPQSALICS